MITELAALTKAEQIKAGSSAFLKGLMEDISGQVSEALSKEEYYNKWGRHYLPSLIFAHQLQMCNNFKDPGVQNYGGELFQKYQDLADVAFNKLPAPKPSITRNYSSSYGGGAPRAAP